MSATLARRHQHPLLGEPRHLDIISSVDARAINSAWWLGTVAGILEILPGFWGIPAGKGSIT